MKYLYLIATCFLLSCSVAFAQKTDSGNVSPKIDTNKVFRAVETYPEFPGGLDAMIKFFSGNVKYPATAKKNGTQGRVIVNFIVEKDGTLTNVKVSRGIGDGCDEEAVRVVKLSSPWKPGTQGGKPVRISYSMPVSFTLTQ
jgi:periplasmic protein TonB